MVTKKKESKNTRLQLRLTKKTKEKLKKKTKKEGTTMQAVVDKAVKNYLAKKKKPLEKGKKRQGLKQETH